MTATSVFTVALLALVLVHAFLRGGRSVPRGETRAISPAGYRIPRLRVWTSNRLGPRVATIVTATLLGLILPTLAGPPYSGPPMLVASPITVQPGASVAIDGLGFDAHQQGTIALDGNTAIVLANYRVRGNGEFDEIITIPSDAAPGKHIVSAFAPDLIASAQINVVAELPIPTPTSTPTATPSATASPTATPSPTPTPRPTPIPTPTPSTPAPPGSASGSIDHVFVVVMENHAYSEVWDTSSTPYTTSLVHSGALATNYHALTHPSLPNYLDLYGGSNYGITTDCDPSSSCTINAVSLADNLEARGLTWKGYFESMSSSCQLTDGNGYIAHHDPFIYFAPIRTNRTRCSAHVVNLSALTTDLASRTSTPNYSFIAPNNCDNTHDCAITTGDTWLSTHIPPILASPACTVDTCLVALTWDEDDGSSSNHVLTVFAGSAARAAATSGIAYTHYSLLRTIEDAFGLPTQTANDANAQPLSDLLR